MRIDAATIWYFAYGSNMQRATFESRRGMRPREARCGRLAGYRLAFDLPVGSGERGVANLIVDANAETYGVLYRISTDELGVLDRTEGVDRGYYRRDEVRVRSLDAGEAVTAWTYLSSHGTEGRLPSLRYMGLLLEGAREHGLPTHYVRALERWQLAVDERQQA
jgi:cation transport regulator ChaC